MTAPREVEEELSPNLGDISPNLGDISPNLGDRALRQAHHLWASPPSPLCDSVSPSAVTP